MPCTSRIEVDNYDFFDNILTYVEKEGKVYVDETPLDNNDDCNGFSIVHTSKHREAGKNICEHLIKLYKSLPNITNGVESDANYVKDWKFLNYWLNSKLKESKINEYLCALEFSEYMGHYSMETLEYSKASDFIYNIKEENLKKMNVLHNLYITYNKIHSALQKASCTPEELKLDCDDKCFDEYKVFRSRCIGINNKFCDELEKFKKLYETLYRTVEDKGDQFSKYFKRLPEDQNINIISTTLLGSTIGLIPLIGILYKFTPLRQVFKPEKKKLPKSYSNNDEELRNISLSNHKYEQFAWNKERYNIKYT